MFYKNSQSLFLFPVRMWFVLQTRLDTWLLKSRAGGQGHWQKPSILAGAVMQKMPVNAEKNKVWTTNRERAAYRVACKQIKRPSDPTRKKSNVTFWYVRWLGYFTMFHYAGMVRQIPPSDAGINAEDRSTLTWSCPGGRSAFTLTRVSGCIWLQNGEQNGTLRTLHPLVATQ